LGKGVQETSGVAVILFEQFRALRKLRKRTSERKPPSDLGKEQLFNDSLPEIRRGWGVGGGTGKELKLLDQIGGLKVGQLELTQGPKSGCHR